MRLIMENQEGMAQEILVKIREELSHIDYQQYDEEESVKIWEQLIEECQISWGCLDMVLYLTTRRWASDEMKVEIIRCHLAGIALNYAKISSGDYIFRDGKWNVSDG